MVVVGTFGAPAELPLRLVGTHQGVCVHPLAVHLGRHANPIKCAALAAELREPAGCPQEMTE